MSVVRTITKPLPTSGAERTSPLTCFFQICLPLASKANTAPFSPATAVTLPSLPGPEVRSVSVLASHNVRPVPPSNAITLPPFEEAYTVLPDTAGCSEYGPLLPTLAFQAWRTDSVWVIGLSSTGVRLSALLNSEQPPRLARLAAQAAATTRPRTKLPCCWFWAVPENNDFMRFRS